MNGEQITAALLFALMHSVLLSLFIRERSGLTRMRKLLTVVSFAIVQTVVRIFDNSESLYAYLYMAANLMIVVCFIHERSSWNWAEALQRGLCYFLLTDCVMQILCHLSQRFIGVDIFRTFPIARQIPSVVLMCVVQWGMLKLLWRFFPPESMTDRNSFTISLLAAVPYLFARQITFWLPIEPEKVPGSLILTMAASCFLALTLIVSLEERLFAEKKKRQAQAQQHVMQLQQQQYIMRRNSIEAVRRQYHDMKNLLLYLGNKTSPENVKEHLSKILSDIHPFETVLDTGSEVIDILLGEKLALCQSKGIPCTVIVDGTMFSFMNPLDLVTVIGNAMDNAIEACERIAPESRFIQVKTAQTEGFAVIRFYNSCDGQPFEVNGRIQPLKHDSENHGFGLLNIQRVAEKYQGEASWQVENNEFVLTLLFPKNKKDGVSSC